MISAQDIRDVRFTKSLGGYKTGEVDDFLDECAATVDALSQEKLENENKMQVLAQTVVEYRAKEDNIRDALINAQKMSDSVLAEAKKEAEKIVADAQKEADTILEKANEGIAKENAEWQRVKKEVGDFKTKLLATYREHLTLIGVLDEEISEKDEPAEESAEETAETSAPTEPAGETPAEKKIDISEFTLEE